MRPSLRSLLPPLLVALAPLVVFLRVWAAPGGEAAYFYGDTNGSYWPDLVYMYRAVADGHVPLWNPYDRAGYPFCCDPQVGLLYPVNALLVLVGLFLGGMPFWLLQAKILLHLALAGVGMYAFLRGRAVGRTPAALGALAFQFGPFLMHNAHFALVWPFAWVPLVLWAVDRATARRTLSAGLLLGLLAGMTAVAGSPPATFYGALVWLPYLGLRLVEAWRATPRGTRHALVLPLAAGGVLALALALPNVLGTAVLTRHSVLESRSFAYAAEGSLAPRDLLGFFLPSADPLYIYVGAGVLVLAGLGATRAREERDTLLWVVVAGLGAILALGSSTFLLRAAYTFIPPFRLFRLAFRYLSLTNLALAVLAARGLAVVIEGSEGTRRALRALAVAFGVLASVALLAELAGKWMARELLSELWRALVFAGLVVGLAWLAAARRSARSAATVSFVVFLELATAAQGAGTLRDGRFEARTTLDGPTLDRLLAEAPSTRVFDEFALGWRAGSRVGLRDFRGYMDPLRLGRYSRVLDAVEDKPTLLGLFGVRYLLHGPHAYLGTTHHRVKAPARIPGVKARGQGIFELPSPAADAYWVGRVRLVKNDAAALALLPRLPTSGAAALAVADLPLDTIAPLATLAARTPGPVAAEIVERTPNRIVFRVTAPERGVVVVNEAWFPGWTATVDGEAAPLLRANSFVQALRVEEGTHEVVLAFRPLYFVVPAWAALAALVGAGGLAGASRWRRRRA